MSAESAAIRSQRVQVERIQAQVTALDNRVERAIEAYNGAVYRLHQTNVRIAANTQVLEGSTRDLARSRTQLADRLRALYRQPQPSFAEILLTSGGISAASDRFTLLKMVGRHDADVVQSIHTLQQRARVAQAQLVVDRRTARHDLAARQQQKGSVLGLLHHRQAILASAKGHLHLLLAAAQARQLAAERQQRAAVTSPGTTPTNVVLPSGSGNAQAAALALQYLGVPYVWGGSSPSGFDCSGLAAYVYGRIGKSVPHYTGAIWAAFPHVPSDQLQAGDLVFFNGGEHVGIYLGNGQFVHAPHTGDVVRVATMSGRSDYVGAVRP